MKTAHIQTAQTPCALGEQCRLPAAKSRGKGQTVEERRGEVRQKTSSGCAMISLVGRVRVCGAAQPHPPCSGCKWQCHLL